MNANKTVKHKAANKCVKYNKETIISRIILALGSLIKIQVQPLKENIPFSDS